MAITLTYYNTENEQWFEIRVEPNVDITIQDGDKTRTFSKATFKCKPPLTEDTDDPMDIMNTVLGALGVISEDEMMDKINVGDVKH